MSLSSLLLTIINKLNGERTIYAGLHLLRGKRSGQTLQDVEYYDLKGLFCVLPKLSTSIYDEAIEELIKENLIEIHEGLLVHITQSGKRAIENLPVYRFNGWDFRGREHFFFARLSLIVQTASHFKVNVTRFMPAQRDAETQRFVRNFLRDQPIKSESFSKELKRELIYLMEQSALTPIQKSIFTHRLVGYGYPGWTWQQLAEVHGMAALSVKLNFIESLHLMIETLEQTTEITYLKKIAIDIKTESHLTDSSLKTKALFQKGLSMEQIAATRRLKMSTIEDHFVEMVINDANFPLHQYIEKKDLKAVHRKSNELGTKRLRILKEEFPQLTYFQLRLILGAQSRGGLK